MVIPRQSLAAYRADFPNYASDLLFIRDRTAIVRTLQMNAVQRAVYDIISRVTAKHRVALFVLKARQTGISTLAEAMIFHQAHTRSNRRCAIYAHDIPSAENVYNMSRMYYDNLPIDWRPMVRYSSKKQLIFENPSRDLRVLKPGSRSRIDVFTAGQKTSGRSFNFNNVHLSEFSNYADGLTLLGALESAVPDQRGNWILIETTANGTDNFSYQEWLRYKEHFAKYGEDSILRPLFIAWYDLPDYTKAFPSRDVEMVFKEELEPEDQAYKEHFNLNWEQMWWRQCRIDSLGGDVDLFNQEMPADDIMAFMTSGRPIFSMKTINAAFNGLKAVTVKECEIDASGRIYSQAGGRLKLFHPPQPGREYTVGVDPVVADQVLAPRNDEKADRAVISVVDNDTLVQVAEWAGRLDPIALAPIAREIARMYNEATIIPERNNSGGAFIYELQKTYFNIYRAETFDQFGTKITEKLGFQTDVHTKKRLIDFSTFVFHQGYCTVNSKDLLEEMRVFVDKQGVKEADKRGQHDDRVMAWMLAMFGAGKDKTTFHPAGKQVEAPAKPALSDAFDPEKRLDYASIDLEGWEKALGRKLLRHHRPRAEARGGGGSGWMAY